MSGNDDTTNGLVFLTLDQEAWEDISRHAVETFPEECCGIILSDRTTDKVCRLRNIQNQLHSLDPETYPRDAKIAYAMDIKELETVVQAAKTTGSKIKAFYHSHPDHEAYFSEEDKNLATPFGEPTFPESAQIVISVYHGKVKQISAYAWSEAKKDFIEIPLRRV